MKKINFENLPSTNTPISADNLNQMQSNIEESAVIVSPTQPTTSEKVWIKKGKNLYDPSKYPLKQGLWTGGTPPTISTNNSGWYVVVPIKGGVPYTISKTNTMICCASTASYPAVGVAQVDEWVSASSKNQLTFETSEEARYLFIGLATGSTQTDEQKANAIARLQIEQGTTATPYEAYVEPKVYLKNDNGVYEEFVSIKELQTNTKTIWSGNLYTTGTNNTQITSENFEEGKLYLFVVQGNSGTFRMTIPYVCGSGNSFQYAYYDGTTVVRWRIIINSTRTGFYLDNDSLNMGSNTGILKIYKVE